MDSTRFDLRMGVRMREQVAAAADDLEVTHTEFVRIAIQQLLDRHARRRMRQRRKELPELMIGRHAE
jgi:hypothetical protein